MNGFINRKLLPEEPKQGTVRLNVEIRDESSLPFCLGSNCYLVFQKILIIVGTSYRNIKRNCEGGF